MSDDEDDSSIRLVWHSEASGPVPPPYPGLVVTDIRVSYGPTDEGTSARAGLDRLNDALAEDILAATDEEILAEAREDGEDPAATAAEVRAMIAMAKERAGK